MTTVPAYTVAAIDRRRSNRENTNLVRWLSGRKQRFAKAPYPKRVPRVRIPPSPHFAYGKLNISTSATPVLPPTPLTIAVYAPAGKSWRIADSASLPGCLPVA